MRSGYEKCVRESEREKCMILQDPGFAIMKGSNNYRVLTGISLGRRKGRYLLRERKSVRVCTLHPSSREKEKERKDTPVICDC
jgi:hypothetical protein